MRRLFLVLCVFFLVSSWLPAQSAPPEQRDTPTVEVDPQQLVSRLKLRLRTTGNGDIIIPATDCDLVFAELELVSNESLQNHEANKALEAENEKLTKRVTQYQKYAKAAPWVCLATLGVGIAVGCIGGYFVQK